jgi:hypothetical protein
MLLYADAFFVFEIFSMSIPISLRAPRLCARILHGVALTGHGASGSPLAIRVILSFIRSSPKFNTQPNCTSAMVRFDQSDTFAQRRGARREG